MPEMRAVLLHNPHNGDYGVDIFSVVAKVGELRGLTREQAEFAYAALNCTVTPADLRKRAEEAENEATQISDDWDRGFEKGRADALRDTATRMEKGNT